MKIKTRELTGPALRYAVAKAENRLEPFDPANYSNVIVVGCQLYARDDNGDRVLWEPDEDWSQGGPIIERESIQLTPCEDMVSWLAGFMFRQGIEDCRGPTPLIAAMRCYVALKLGEEVEVPEEVK